MDFMNNNTTTGSNEGHVLGLGDVHHPRCFRDNNLSDNDEQMMNGRIRIKTTLQKYKE